MKTPIREAALAVGLFCLSGHACIWDSKTLRDEKHKDPDLAAAILHPQTGIEDSSALRSRIEHLRALPNRSDPAWWNDLAGAYLRLSQPAEALAILEPLTNTFPNNYGIHANLGTAYHLLGRFVEAEREIARDLDINPEAHFGLEKYHLALLQYLVRDEGYRLRHVYVDEFTWTFWEGRGMFVRDFDFGDGDRGTTNDLPVLATEMKEVMSAMTAIAMFPERSTYEIEHRLANISQLDERPLYRRKWDLAKDAKLQKGVIYMANLNPNEPACWVMLAVLATKQTDKNLTIAALEKAIRLGTPQKPLLQARINQLRKHISEAQRERFHERYIFYLSGWAIFVVILLFCASKLRQCLGLRRRREPTEISP